MPYANVETLFESMCDAIENDIRWLVIDIPQSIAQEVREWPESMALRSFLTEAQLPFGLDGGEGETVEVLLNLERGIPTVNTRTALRRDDLELRIDINGDRIRETFGLLPLSDEKVIFGILNGSPVFAMHRHPRHNLLRVDLMIVSDHVINRVNAV